MDDRANGGIVGIHGAVFSVSCFCCISTLTPPLRLGGNGAFPMNGSMQRDIGISRLIGFGLLAFAFALCIAATKKEEGKGAGKSNYDIPRYRQLLCHERALVFPIPTPTHQPPHPDDLAHTIPVSFKSFSCLAVPAVRCCWE
jgi:hypothetical protein